MYSNVSSIEEGRILLRGHDLAADVMGKYDFTEAIYLAIVGERPPESVRRVLDAVLVSLIDHGVTSSTLVARMTYRAAPEAFQGAIAAGVLNSGGRVLGSMEGCGRLLAEWVGGVAERGAQETAEALVAAERNAGRRIPGLGHNLHEKGDVRADRLFEIAGQTGHPTPHADLLQAVAAEVARAGGKPLTINVTGAVAAVLLDLGIPWQILRGFGILSRVPGLIAHLAEEIQGGKGARLVRRLQDDDAWTGLD
jgi:citrate synthase